MRLDSRRQRPENIRRIEHVDIFVKDKDVLGMINGQRGSSRPARISFRHLFHGDEHVVVRMTAGFAHCRHTRYSLANSPEISSFARKIHPRFVAFRGDDRLTHSALTVCDRTHFIVGRADVTLGSEIARRLPKRSLNDSLSRQQCAFDYDLGIRWYQQVVTPDLGWR